MCGRDETLLPSNLPDVLIHLHIPKTGGTSLNSAIKHAFRGHEVFELGAQCDPKRTALDIASLESVSEGLHQFGLDRVRYISGHIPYGVHRLFGTRAKYFTLARDPIERVISTFFWFRANKNNFCQAGKPLSFEEYVETRNDIYLNNYQVRVLSGSAELDGGASPGGPHEVIFGPRVERRHLEQAKRNIAEHFLVAAPLERLTETALVLRTMYGWPMRRLHNEYKNQNPKRPQAGEISSKVIRTILDCNAYDSELYQWIKYRFFVQCSQFEPQLSRDFERFQRINRVLNSAGKMFPHKLRKRLAGIFLHGRYFPLSATTQPAAPRMRRAPWLKRTALMPAERPPILVRLSRTSIADEMRIEHTRRVLGE
jgi:hypothetical protein